MVHPNCFPTSVAVLGKHAVEAGEAVGPALSHDVALPSQVPVTLEAGKVLHMPSPALCFRTLVGEDDLKGGSLENHTAWTRATYPWDWLSGTHEDDLKVGGVRQV